MAALVQSLDKSHINCLLSNAEYNELVAILTIYADFVDGDNDSTIKLIEDICALKKQRLGI